MRSWCFERATEHTCLALHPLQKWKKLPCRSPITVKPQSCRQCVHRIACTTVWQEELADLASKICTQEVSRPVSTDNSCQSLFQKHQTSCKCPAGRSRSRRLQCTRESCASSRLGLNTLMCWFRATAQSRQHNNVVLGHLIDCYLHHITDLSSLIHHAVGSTQLSRHQQQYSLLQSLEELAGLAETAKVQVRYHFSCRQLQACVAIST